MARKTNRREFVRSWTGSLGLMATARPFPAAGPEPQARPPPRTIARAALLPDQSVSCRCNPNKSKNRVSSRIFRRLITLLLAFFERITFVHPIYFEIGWNHERLHLVVTELMQQFDSGAHIGT